MQTYMQTQTHMQALEADADRHTYGDEDTEVDTDADIN